MTTEPAPPISAGPMIPPESDKRSLKLWDDADRVALVILLDQACRNEARDEPPPDATKGEWLFGYLDYTEDVNGWSTPVEPKVWIAGALTFWRAVIDTGEFIPRNMAEHPLNALTRWPAVERAVGDYLALYPWLIDGPANHPVTGEIY